MNDNAFNTQEYLFVSNDFSIKYKAMPDRLSVYAPLNSLNEETIALLFSIFNNHILETGVSVSEVYLHFCLQLQLIIK